MGPKLLLLVFLSFCVIYSSSNEYGNREDTMLMNDNQQENAMEYFLKELQTKVGEIEGTQGTIMQGIQMIMQESQQKVQNKVEAIEDKIEMLTETLAEPPLGDYDGFILKGVGYLEFIPSRLTWPQAHLACAGLGMRLAEEIPRDLFHEIWNNIKRYKTSWPGISMWNGAKGRKWQTSKLAINNNLYQIGDPNGSMAECILLHITGDKGNRKTNGLCDRICAAEHFVLCQMLPPS